MNVIKFGEKFDDQGKVKEPNPDTKDPISTYSKIEYKSLEGQCDIIENMCRQARKYLSDSQIKATEEDNLQ